ncbi:B12-binding domain-containing radical SAM protein [candidate division WOR-3 bacterium]|nr:B12-binding domain-containing radical SAM protein [candidate division WOR-3 bacterium]
MIKILLISTNDSLQGLPSLGPTYIASYLRKYMDDVNIKILEYIPKDLTCIHRFSPDLIGISAITIQYNAAVEIANNIKKEMDVPVIIGGFHISELPNSLPSSCDVGVIGEGEQTMLELVSLFKERGLKKEQLHNIKGIVFRENKRIIKTEKREKIKPLDKIPYPDRDLLDMEHYLAKTNVFGPYFGRGTFMFTSRGCPYKCAFCSAAAFWGNIRYFSPEYVLGEIKLLIEKYKVKYVHLYDDLFAINKKRLHKIAELICKDGINHEVEFGINAKADIFDEDICKNLKRMGVINVDFGIESGSQKFLDYLKNNTLTIRQIRNAVKLAKRYGFSVCGSLIIGSPGETEKDMLKTLVFIKSLKLDKFAHFIATPYPKTLLWESAMKKGKVSENMNWNMLKMKELGGKLEEEDIINKNQILLTDEVSIERFVKIYKLFEKERLKLFNYRWDK